MQINLTQINLTPLFQAVIMVLSALITFRLIPWIKAHTTTEQQTQLRAAVRVGVYAAEQIYGAGQGHYKMQYVKQWLKEQGFDVDDTEIEAAVKELLNQFRDGNMFDLDEGEGEDIDDDIPAAPEVNYAPAKAEPSPVMIGREAGQPPIDAPVQPIQEGAAAGATSDSRFQSEAADTGSHGAVGPFGPGQPTRKDWCDLDDDGNPVPDEPQSAVE